MEAFLANISSFPTAIFTTLSAVALIYWLISLLGVLDIDIIEFDADVETGEVSFMVSALSFFGLTGVPLAVLVTFLSLISFVFCYYAVYFGLLITSATWLTVLTGTAIMIVSFFVALPITGFAIKPLRKLYSKLDEQTAEKVLLGVTCTVRSSRVDTDFGEAECIVDGASLIIKVRSDDEPFKKGDKVVIIEHDADLNLFYVVSSSKFNH